MTSADLTDEIARQVDDVRVQVSVRAAAGDLLLQTPYQRELRVHDPVLQIHRAPVVDLADLARVDHLLRKRHGRDTAVVECRERALARLGRRRGHLLCLVQRVRQRLLADHVLAGFQRRQRHGQVQVARRADVDDADLRVGDDLLPVGLPLLEAEFGRSGLDGVFVAAADRLEHGLVGDVVEVRDLAPSVGVGLAHERVSDHADADFLGHWVPPRFRRILPVARGVRSPFLVWISHGVCARQARVSPRKRAV